MQILDLWALADVENNPKDTITFFICILIKDLCILQGNFIDLPKITRYIGFCIKAAFLANLETVSFYNSLGWTFEYKK
jgi:hypothetical protein